MKAMTVLALVASPAQADVYRCSSAYQDTPCANAKVVDNINGLSPSHAEQMKTFQRDHQNSNLAAQLSRNRESNERTVVTVRLTAVDQRPAFPRSTGPDRYYDCADKFNDRAVSGTAYIQRK